MKTLVLMFGAAAWLAAAAPQEQSAANNGCTLASLEGSYGAVWSGIGAGPNDTGRFAIVGTLVADGKGKLTLNGTASLQTLSQSVRTVNGSGTYLINPDCTGSATVSVHGDTMHLSFILVNQGARGLLMRADKYSFMTGEFDKL